MVHRMVREYGKPKGRTLEQVLPDIASQSSSRERRAIDAEREVEAMKKAVIKHGDHVVKTMPWFQWCEIWPLVELPNTVEG